MRRDRPRAASTHVLAACAALTAALAAGAGPTAAADRGGPVSGPDSALPGRYVVPGDRTFPVGLAHDRRTDALFLGGTRDGTLFRGEPGRARLRVWLPGGTNGRTTTSGLNTDGRGRLYVGGGSTNRLWVHDIASGRLLATLSGLPGGYVNDIAVATDGTAYVTDSMAHVVYRVTERAGRWRLERWLDLAGTPVEQLPGHNLNGIAVLDGRSLLAVHSQSGRLYRIDRQSRQVAEVDLGGGRLYGGDGLVLAGDRLYVVQGGLSTSDPQAQVSVVRLVAAGTGRVESVLTDPEFRHPSTARLVHGRLLVVNSQYNTGQAGGRPHLPFTVSALNIQPKEGNR